MGGLELPNKIRSGPRICVLLVREVAPLRYLHYKHEANKLWASTYLPIGQLLHMPSGLFLSGGDPFWHRTVASRGVGASCPSIVEVSSSTELPLRLPQRLVDVADSATAGVT
jgi:hypothetical protein